MMNAQRGGVCLSLCKMAEKIDVNLFWQLWGTRHTVSD